MCMHEPLYARVCACTCSDMHAHKRMCLLVVFSTLSFKPCINLVFGHICHARGSRGSGRSWLLGGVVSGKDGEMGMGRGPGCQGMKPASYPLCSVS